MTRKTIQERIEFHMNRMHTHMHESDVWKFYARHVDQLEMARGMAPSVSGAAPEDFAEVSAE